MAAQEFLKVNFHSSPIEQVGHHVNTNINVATLMLFVSG